MVLILALIQKRFMVLNLKNSDDAKKESHRNQKNMSGF